MNDHLEVIWSGGPGLSRYIGNSSLTGTMPSSMSLGEGASLERKPLAPEVIDAIRHALKSGLREPIIRAKFNVSSWDVKRIREGMFS